MIPDAARMRRWMLQGAPFIGLCALFMHAGGGAAGMLIWMGLGLFHLPRGHYPYPRKRGRQPGRLFFSFTLGIFLITLPASIVFLVQPDFFQHRLLAPALLQIGSVSIALSLSTRLFQSAVSERMCRALSLLFFMLAMTLIFYMQ